MAKKPATKSKDTAAASGTALAKPTPIKVQVHRRIPQNDQAKLQLAIAGIEKEFGKNTVSTFNPNVDMTRFPYQFSSGSVGLDIALGNHMRRDDGSWQTGYAPARILEIFGGEGSGKTTLMLLAIANCQAMGGVCVFIDAEHSLDPMWARRLGVDLNTLRIVQPDSGIQALQVCESFVRSEAVNLVIIDSVDALIPPQVMESDIGDSTVGAVARMMGDALRRFATLKGKSVNCNVMFTNQLRSKIGQYGGDTTPGGRALPFYADYRIQVRRGPNLTVQEGPFTRTYGHQIQAKVIKNKVAPPYKDANMDLIYGVGIDTVGELIDKSAEFGVMEGPYYRWEPGSPVLAHGKDAFRTLLQNNPNMLYPLYNKLFEVVLSRSGFLANGTRMPNFALDQVVSYHNQFAPLTLEEKREVEKQEIPDV